MDTTAPLTRNELATASERAFRETFAQLARHGRTSISERTIRFWTREGLLPRRGGPNRLGRYEPGLVHRCVLIRRLARERSLGLPAIRAVLAVLDDEAVRHAAEGGPLPPAVDAAAVAETDSTGSIAMPPIGTFSDSAPRPTAIGRPAQAAPPPAIDDRPQGLQRISDADRAAALGEALRATLNRGFDITVLGLECAVGGYRGSFHAPTALDLEILPNAASGNPVDAMNELQRLDDDLLCDAIAAALGDRCGEAYRAEVLLKRYLRPATLPERRQPTGLRLAVLVGLAAA